ncbi:hypothetical protein J7E55_19315, partial [Bacillus sp. ISL-53]|nr:hypothetical protein [Bacillus sp. ISL-53]
LSADCLPSLLSASACGVSASQLLGRSVAHFFHPLRNTVKTQSRITCSLIWFGMSSLSFFLKITFQLISEILLPFRRLSAKPSQRKRLWGLS